MVDFGWSAGCLVEAIKLADKIRKALKDAGGAKEHYAETVAFMTQIEAVFKHLEKHVEGNPESPYRDAIESHLKLIEGPWKKMEAVYIEKYEKSLGAAATRSKLKQAPRKMQWAVKDIDESIRKVRIEILEPLKMVDSLLSLETMRKVQALSETCRKVVEDLQLASISSSLESGFDQFSRYAVSQDRINAQQLDLLRSLQRSMARQQAQVADLLTEVDSIMTFRSGESASIVEILVLAKETTSTVARFEKELQTSAPHQSKGKELRIEESRLGMIEATLQELMEFQKGIAVASGARNSRDRSDIEVDWKSLCRILVTATSAFAFGYSAKTMKRSQDSNILEPVDQSRFSRLPQENHCEPMVPQVADNDASNITIPTTYHAPLATSLVNSVAPRGFNGWANEFLRGAGGWTARDEREQEQLGKAKDVPASGDESEEKSSGLSLKIPDDVWICTVCGAANLRLHNPEVCPACGHTPPLPLPPDQQSWDLLPTWSCPKCKNLNSDATLNSCPICGCKAPPVGSLPSWSCPSCKNLNSDLTLSICPICGWSDK